MFIIEVAQIVFIHPSSRHPALVPRLFIRLNILSQLSRAPRRWNLAINQGNCPSPAPVARHQDHVNFLYIPVTHDQAGAAAEAPYSPSPLRHPLPPYPPTVPVLCVTLLLRNITHPKLTCLLPSIVFSFVGASLCGCFCFCFCCFSLVLLPSL